MVHIFVCVYVCVIIMVLILAVGRKISSKTQPFLKGVLHEGSKDCSGRQGLAESGREIGSLRNRSKQNLAETVIKVNRVGRCTYAKSRGRKKLESQYVFFFSPFFFFFPKTDVFVPK